MNAFPAGITTALVHLDAPISFIGQVGRIHATITSNVPLVWAATGTPIGNFIDNVSLDPGVPLELSLPHTDQAGFLDESGKTITGWYYRIEVTYELDGQTIPFPARDFQIVGAQDNVDLALIPGGKATEPVTAPQASVVDIGGFTGSVTMEELQLHLVDNTRDVDKPISKAQAAVNARKTDMRTFEVGASDGRRWVRLATLNGESSDNGAHLTAIISGTGDRGEIRRGTMLIHFVQRGLNGVDVKLWSFGTAETSGPAEYYTVQTGPYTFELWAKLASYNFPHSIHTLSAQSAVVTVDKIGTTAPVGTVAPTAPKLWVQLDMSRVSDVVAATALPTPNALVRRDAAGETALAALSLGGTYGPAHATRKDYVDGKVAAVTYASLGTIPTSVLPPLAVNEVFTAASQAAMLALTAERGDMAIRTDVSKTFVLSSDNPGTLANWREVMAAGQVLSVAGRTGVVTLAKADVGLGSADNTSDANKPISTAQQTALNLKADKSAVSNVNNTSDLAKPISTATQAALDASGARVTALEKGVGAYAGKLTADVTFDTNGERLVLTFPSVTFNAGRVYAMFLSGKNIAGGASQAVDLFIREGAVGLSGVRTTDPILATGTMWTAAIAAAGSVTTMSFVHTPDTTYTRRIYLSGLRVVGTGNITLYTGWSLVIKDLGPAL